MTKQDIVNLCSPEVDDAPHAKRSRKQDIVDSIPGSVIDLSVDTEAAGGHAGVVLLHRSQYWQA